MGLISRLFRYSSEDKALHKYLKTVFRFVPSDLELYKLAFTHSSYFPAKGGLKVSNERLEFLGDAILDSIVAHFLYREFPDLSEGELTKRKSKIVSRKNLNSLALQADVQRHVKHALKFDTKQTSVLGNALEAVIGAIYLDKGYDTCKSVILTFLDDADLNQMFYEQKDYKSLLHEWSQRQKKEVTFPLVNEVQKDGRYFYEVNVLIGKEVYGSGVASSKKKAQQMAAKEACEKLGV